MKNFFEKFLAYAIFGWLLACGAWIVAAQDWDTSQTYIHQFGPIRAPGESLVEGLYSTGDIEAATSEITAEKINAATGDISSWLRVGGAYSTDWYSAHIQKYGGKANESGGYTAAGGLYIQTYANSNWIGAGNQVRLIPLTIAAYTSSSYWKTAGTIDYIRGLSIGYGAYANAAGATPTINNVYGIYLQPYNQPTGNDAIIGTWYDLYIAPVGETNGGGIGNHYGIYQADGDALNYLPGTLYGTRIDIDANSSSEALRIYGVDQTDEWLDVYVAGAGQTIIKINPNSNGFFDFQPNDTDGTYGILLRESGDTSDWGKWLVSSNYMNIAKNSTEALTGLVIDDNNYVGINNDPDVPLDVQGTGEPIAIFHNGLTSGEDAIVEIRGARNGNLNDETAGIQFTDYDSNFGGSGATINLARVYGSMNSTEGGDGELHLEAYDGTAWKNGITIEADGSLTFGNSGASGYRAHKFEGGVIDLFIGAGNLEIQTGSTSGWARGLQFNDSSSNAIGGLWGFGTGDVFNYLALGGTAYNDAAIYIDSSKNVGIGTNAPARLLDVNGQSVFRDELLIQDTATNTLDYGGRRIRFYGADGTNNPQAYISHYVDIDDQKQYVSFSGGYSTGFVRPDWIFEYGDVGIGTLDPDTKFHVYSNDPGGTLSHLQIGSGNTTGAYVLQLENASSQNASQHGLLIGVQSGGGDIMNGRMSGTEVFTVANQGTVRTAGNVYINNDDSGDGYLVFGSNTSTGEYIKQSDNDINLYAGGVRQINFDGDANNIFLYDSAEQAQWKFDGYGNLIDRVDNDMIVSRQLLSPVAHSQTLFDLQELIETESIYALADLPNGSGITDANYATVNDASLPFGKYVSVTNYRSIYSTYIPVEIGDVLTGECWYMRPSSSSATTRLYIGLERYDKDLKPIASNNGCNYFLAGGIVPTADDTWYKRSATLAMPTSHTPYDGSDGGPVRYVRLRVLINYSASTGEVINLMGLRIRRQSMFGTQEHSDVDFFNDIDLHGYQLSNATIVNSTGASSSTFSQSSGDSYITIETTDSGGGTTESGVQYYPFENNANDYFGNYNGTNNGVDFTSTYKKVGSYSAYPYDNTDYIRIAGGAATHTGDFSVSCWIYRTGSSDYQTIFRRDDSSDYIQIQYDKYHSPEQIRVKVTTSGGSCVKYAEVSSNINTSTWYHLAVTFDSSTGEARIWVDGEEMTAGTELTHAGTITATTYAYIGNAGTSGYPWQGCIDDFAWFSRELTDLEIGMLYSGISPSTIATDGPDAGIHLTTNSKQRDIYLDDVTGITSIDDATGSLFQLSPDGDGWFKGGLNAENVVDRCKLPATESLDVLRQIQGLGEPVDGWIEIDHDSLPAGVLATATKTVKEAVITNNLTGEEDIVLPIRVLQNASPVVNNKKDLLAYVLENFPEKTVSKDTHSLSMRTRTYVEKGRDLGNMVSMNTDAIIELDDKQQALIDALKIEIKDMRAKNNELESKVTDLEARLAALEQLAAAMKN